MMAENESLEEIERLSRHEFDLDVGEQKQLQAQCEVEVQKVFIVWCHSLIIITVATAADLYIL